MNKYLVYTSNLPFAPKNLNEVINFAKENDKFRIAPAELNAHLSDVKTGDNIITKKGNSLYIIRAIKNYNGNLCNEDIQYLDKLAREYDVKKVNITSVANRIKFETWCKEMRPLLTTNIYSNNSKNSNKMEKNSVKNMMNRMKEMFMPTEVSNVRIATDGNLCVATTDGYVSINANNELVSYPEEFTLAMPVYAMCKPATQLAVGDIIVTDKNYAKVTKIDGQKISAIGYTGAGKTIHTIKDFLFNQTMVRVVVSLAGNLGGQMNPMMMFALSKSGNDSMLPLMMMSQNNGNVGMNPMMLALLADKEPVESGKNSTLETMMMMSMMQGNNNPFANMFGQAPAVQTPVVADDENKKE